MKRLMISAAALWLAATPVSAADDGVCRSVAAGLRTLPAAPYDPASDLIDGPIQRLAAAHGGGLVIDQSAELTSDQVRALPATLKSRFRATAAVLRAVDDLSPGSGAVWLLRMGGGNVYAVEVTAGTMDCESFAFFEASPGKTAKIIAQPPQLAAETDDAGAFCVTDEGLLGRVGPTPVFIEQGWDPTDPDYQLVLAAWRGAWAKPCKLRVIFRSSYRVDGFDCHGSACGELPQAAVAMAAARQALVRRDSAGGNPPETFAWGPAASTAARAKVARLKDLIGEPAATGAPGVAGDTQHGFGDDSVVFPLVLGEETYAAVLGHGSVGWRIYPDFLLALYDLKGGAADRVASVHIVRDVGPAQSIKLSP